MWVHEATVCVPKAESEIFLARILHCWPKFFICLVKLSTLRNEYIQSARKLPVNFLEVRYGFVWKLQWIRCTEGYSKRWTWPLWECDTGHICRLKCFRYRTLPSPAHCRTCLAQIETGLSLTYIYIYVYIYIYIYSTTPIIRTLVIRIANYPQRLGPSGNFVENSTKLTCLEITGYRSSTVL
jgi:hypothetical protein